MKTLFVSLLALPVGSVLGSVVSQLKGAPVLARKSGAIICYCGSSSGSVQDDAGGHHRYYGRSAYP